MIVLKNGLVKLSVITLAILLINLIFILNYDFASSQSELSNDELRPDKNNFWEYRRFDYVDNSIYYYNLTMTGETTIKVANKDLDVLILEGYGEIEQWPRTLEPADEAVLYIKKLINKENMELIKYTQYIDLVYVIDGSVSTRYIHENITYNYEQFNKPSNITIGSNWSKKVTRTEDKNIKGKTGEIDKFVHQDQINSTFLVDSVQYVMTSSRGYNTLMVLERQYHEDIIDTTIEYYYADDTNGYVQKIRRGFDGEMEELEKLISFKSGEIDNGETPNGDPENGDNDNGFDLGDQNVQILLGAIFILIALMIFGYIGYRKYK